MLNDKNVVDSTNRETQNDSDALEINIDNARQQETLKNGDEDR